jgi:Uma2 family endonuclease
MATASVETLHTPEELLNGEEGRYELIDGQLVEKPMGAKASLIAVNATTLIRPYSRENQLGLLFGADCGYQIFPSQPSRVRYPDASFIRRGRLPDDTPPDGHVRIAPDWVLEIVSPNDLAKEVEQKIEDYLQVGISLSWLVYPDTRRVYVYRPGQAVLRLTPEDELFGYEVWPGFSLRVAELFADVKP